MDYSNLKIDIKSYYETNNFVIRCYDESFNVLSWIVFNRTEKEAEKESYIEASKYDDWSVTPVSIEEAISIKYNISLVKSVCLVEEVLNSVQD